MNIHVLDCNGVNIFPDHTCGPSGLGLWTDIFEVTNIDGLVQDCSNSIANALELLQSCTKPPT